jgi:GNAT superfamily N-acetyltransferase
MAASVGILQATPPIAPEPITAPDPILPGTTIPSAKPISQPAAASTKPATLPGPTIHGKATTLHFLTPAHLPTSPFLPQIYSLINTSFSSSHARSAGALPADRPRLRSPEQFLEQVGSEPGTFIGVLTQRSSPSTKADDSEEDVVIATAGAHRWLQPPVVVAWDDTPGGGSAFKRFKIPDRIDYSGSEIWELKFLATDVKLQGMGLASWMMGAVDDEVKRRFGSSAAGVEGEFKELWMVLDTLKEVNEGFYLRRGYEVDYEDIFPPGTYGSEKGFTVIFLSKRLV